MTSPKPRRTRSGTVAADLEAFQKAADLTAIDWPAQVSKLPDPEQQKLADAMFADLLTARCAEDWRRVDTIAAGRLCVVTVEIDAVERRLRDEGLTLMGGKSGNVPLANPLVSILSQMTARAANLTRQLSLFGTGVANSTTHARAKASNTARAVINRASTGASADALLAGADDLLG